MTAARPVLDGVRVLDFTTVMSGPTCSMLLADFGADVLKVEPPAGDDSRRWGRHHFGPDEQFSGLFAALNRNKSGIVIDLKSPEGRETVGRLIAEADVLLENYKPGVADRLGIGYDDAAAVNPRLVYASISGFGQTGPLRDRPGLDMLLQAYAGHMSITGEPDRPSVRTGPSPIDMLTGAHAAFGVMLALFERTTSGVGQYLETSLYDTAVHMISHFIADYTTSGRLPVKTGPYFAFSSPYGNFQASDREFFLGASNQRAFERLCDAIGREDLPAHERFATNGKRIEHRQELHDELRPIFASRPAAWWVDLCVRLSIPASLVEDVAEVVAQEQAAAREMVIDLGRGDGRCAGIPLKLARTPGTVRRPAPLLGADNARLEDGWTRPVTARP